MAISHKPARGENTATSTWQRFRSMSRKSLREADVAPTQPTMPAVVTLPRVGGSAPGARRGGAWHVERPSLVWSAIDELNFAADRNGNTQRHLRSEEDVENWIESVMPLVVVKKRTTTPGRTPRLKHQVSTRSRQPTPPSPHSKHAPVDGRP